MVFPAVNSCLFAILGRERGERERERERSVDALVRG